MARIPTAENVRQVRPGQLPQVRVSQAAAGIDVYRAQGERKQTLGRVGQMLEQEAVKRRDEEDTAAAQFASTELAKVEHRLGYGDPDNDEPGLFNLSGQAAMLGRQSYEEKLEAEYQRIAEGLSKGAKLRFERVGTARKLRAMDKSAAYANRERRNFIKLAAKSEIDMLTQQHITDPNSPDYLPNIEIAIRKFMHKEVGDPANSPTPAKAQELNRIIDAAILDATTKAHIGALDNLLASDSPTAAEDAEKYFKTHKKGIAADKHDDIKKLLEVQTLLEKSHTAADAVMAMKNLGPSGRLAYARANYTGEVRDAIVDRIKTRNAEIRTAQEAGKRAASAKLWNLVADGKNIHQIKKLLTSTEWSYVAHQMPNVQNVALSLARGEVDLTRSTGFEDRFYELDTEDKAAIEIKSLDGQTTAAEKSRLIPQILGAKAELKKKAAKTEEAIRKQAPYNDAARLLRENAPTEWATAWDKNEKNQAKRDMGDIFVAHMNAKVKDYLAANKGAPPTVPEMTAWAREIYTPGSLALQSAAVIKSDPKGVGEGERSIEVAAHVAPERMSQKQLDAAYQDYDDIPAQTRTEIENQLTQLKVPKRTKLVEQIAAARQLGQAAREHGLIDAALRGVDYEEYQRLHNLSPAEQRTATLSASDMQPGLKKLIRESLEEAGMDLNRSIIEQLGAAYVLRDRARIQRLLSPQSETQ